MITESHISITDDCWYPMDHVTVNSITAKEEILLGQKSIYEAQKLKQLRELIQSILNSPEIPNHQLYQMLHNAVENTK